jgi:hypothetical protein
MVQSGDLTYRIVEVRRGSYDAFRILDDVLIGSFQTRPRLSIHPVGVHDAELLAVALIAVRQAKTVPPTHWLADWR